MSQKRIISLPIDKDSLIAFIDSKESFSGNEINHILKVIAKEIANGEDPREFSPYLDKVIGNEMADRQRDIEEAWQNHYDSI